jgi:hypothetical protein
MLPLLVGKRANSEVSRPVNYIERDAKEEIDEKDPSPADQKI